MGSTTLTFPGFHGATRRLVLLNAAAFFVFAIVQTFNLDAFKWLVVHMGLAPELFLFHGWLWQPFTYSLVQLGLLNTVFAVLSIWFLAGFLEGFHSDSWVTGLYAAGILGTALAGVVLAFAATAAGMDLGRELLTGSFGGSFGLVIAIGVLYGDIEFTLFPIPVQIKARYLAVIYAVVSVAMQFGSSRLNAFAQLGGGLAAWLYVRMAPRRGVSFAASEGWYGLRNRYYRWKRRRASRKFEVYMKKQGRTVRFDGQGRQIDDDDDPKRWN